LAYYSYFPKLPYYEESLRPARFFLETNAWSYLDATTPEEEAAARLVVSNWMLFDWFDTIVEGGLAKIFKTVGDVRAPAAFGLYKSLQNDILTGEDVESIAL
jgi:hypothetical protein